MFVSVASDDTFNHVSAAPIDALDEGAFVSALSCNRVYFRGNRGMCLTPDAAAGDTPIWRADVFDEQFHVLPAALASAFIRPEKSLVESA